MNEPQAERRQSPRIPHGFLVRYRLPTARGMVWRMSPLRDLSRGGARFLAEGFFEIGQWINLQLIVPNAKQPVDVSVRVVWSKPAKALLNLHEYGVVFELIQPTDRQRLEAALAPLLKSHPPSSSTPRS